MYNSSSICIWNLRINVNKLKNLIPYIGHKHSWHIQQKIVYTLKLTHVNISNESNF